MMFPLEGVEAGDVGVVQRSEYSRLPFEAGQPLGVLRDLLQEQLDRHLAAELRILRPIDLSHAPGTEGRNDLVVTQASAF